MTRATETPARRSSSRDPTEGLRRDRAPLLHGRGLSEFLVEVVVPVKQQREPLRMTAKDSAAGRETSQASSGMVAKAT